MMALRAVIAGGGTGGHIFPAVAIAHALKKRLPDAEILFIGAKGKMEMEKVPQAGYRIEGLDIAGFNRSSLIRNIGLPFKLIRSFLQVRSIFSAFRPDVAIGVGGYSTFPVLKYAQQKGIPTYILESNSFAGKANILLGKKAAQVFVATDGMEKFFPAGKIMLTGNPVRASILLPEGDRDGAVRFFGLDPQAPVVLVTGGSLGAKSINEAIERGLERITSQGIQLIWQTGKPFADQAKRSASGNARVWVNEFIREMDKAFAAADLIVSRAGAMAISEICVIAKPAVFVPYPHAAEDHQTSNARNLQDKRAGIMIRDSEAGEKLVDEVIALLNDRARREELSRNIAPLGIRNADEVIADTIIRQLGQ
jgi:UDP-N-acetylglucosamine--N-acetylmuramyl-(pentapeptide) pyrophosphoryl-undecaprenol N-acetylglucosamine transferase